jgi:hypothetical protein
MFEIVYRDAGHIVQFIHESVRDFLLSKSGLGIYGLHSYLDFSNTSKDMLAMACQRFFGFMRVHTALPPPGPDGFVPVNALVAFCSRSFPSPHSLLGYPLLSYMVQFGLKHLEKSSWFISGAEAKLCDEGMIHGLRNMLECLFVLRSTLLASEVSIDGYNAYELSPTIPKYDCEFLGFIASYTSAFGLSIDDFSRLAACVNNRYRFLRDLHLDLHKRPGSEGVIRPSSAFKFHQFVWITARGARDDEIVNKAGQGLRLSSSSLPSAKDAFCLCEATAKGFAFLAHFTYNCTPETDATSETATSTQIQWELSDDREEYMHFRNEVLGCQDDDVPSSIPFHTVSDSGYISLLIRESLHTRSTTGDLTYTAFGIRQRECDEVWRSIDTVSLYSFDSYRAEDGMLPRDHWILLLPDPEVHTPSSDAEREDDPFGPFPQRF